MAAFSFGLCNAGAFKKEESECMEYKEELGRFFVVTGVRE
jgi:hypothetical protein